MNKGEYHEFARTTYRVLDTDGKLWDLKDTYVKIMGKDRGVVDALLFVKGTRKEILHSRGYWRILESILKKEVYNMSGQLELDF